MNRCEECGLPVPTEVESLAAQLVGELRQGATSGRTLAGRLHRRRDDVMHALHELADAGIVALERPTRSRRSEQWSLKVGGATWDPHGGASEVSRGSTPAITLVGLLAALVAAPRPVWARLVLGVGVGLALVALGSLIRSAEGSP
jgi:hypothetical protein